MVVVISTLDQPGSVRNTEREDREGIKFEKWVPKGFYFHTIRGNRSKTSEESCDYSNKSKEQKVVVNLISFT